jgi:hypothetical protein
VILFHLAASPMSQIEAENTAPGMAIIVHAADTPNRGKACNEATLAHRDVHLRAYCGRNKSFLIWSYRLTDSAISPA